MARPVDPLRHQERRAQIIDAALTTFASLGYTASTTAEICLAAGIGSGTFFHYFPTKESLVVGILEMGLAETEEFFAAQEGRDDSLQVVLDYVAHQAESLRDPRAAGFIGVVGGLVTRPDVARALRAEEEAEHRGLITWLQAGHRDGWVRVDLAPARLAHWVVVLLDGFAAHITEAGDFDPLEEAPLLVEHTRRLVTAQRSL